MTYLTNITTWFSQTLHVWLLAGNPDLTVSARCYMQRNDPRWCVAYRIINDIWFWQEDHCKLSFCRDVTHARQVVKYSQLDPTDCA